MNDNSKVLSKVLTTKSNLPIAYDYHGDIPFNVPFAEIKPQDIHIYLDLDTQTGSSSCQQNCSHCWFVNYQKVHNKSFDINEGQLIKEVLSAEGYKVFARYVDSFALKGDFMKIHGPAHNREFRQGQDHKPTDTMKKGDAWTSGRPLLGDDYMELLDLAVESGYGTISITFHGLIDKSYGLKDERLYPIKGVFSGKNTEKVISRIFEYNQSKNQNMRINIGVTIGKHNHTQESLIRYAHYFNALGVDTVRFNNFTDHGSRHPELPLTHKEIEQFYRDIKWIHENIKLNFQLAVSEDFGTYGIDVMKFPEHVGWCRAGRQLFTIIPADMPADILAEQKILSQTDTEKNEKIGDIVACVNIFEPHLGVLSRKTNLITGVVSYSLHFDHQAIDKFSKQRMNGVFKNGCFAKEMLELKKPELTQQAKWAISRMKALQLNSENVEGVL